jgi:membrane-associated phospholipid phosphatase
MRVRAQYALLAAAGCALGLVAIVLIAFEWPLARTHDAKSLVAFQSLSANSRLDSVAGWIASTAKSPLPFVLAGVFFVLVALLRRQPRLALAVPIAMGGAMASAELLKRLFSHTRWQHLVGPPSPHLAAASFPSGHATGAMAVALCAVLVAPPLLRPLAGLLGCALVLAVSYSVLILGWHYPSDVLAGFLVAGLWVSLALAVFWLSMRRHAGARRRGGGRSARTSAALVPAGLAAIALFAVIASSNIAISHAHLDGSLILAAGAVAALAVAMTAGLVLAIRPRARVMHEPASTVPSRSLSAASSSTRGV